MCLRTKVLNLILSRMTRLHKGTNIGSISLDNIAPVFIDVANKEAFIDIGGMHARAQVEKGVKWINDKSEVEGEEAKEYWLAW